MTETLVTCCVAFAAVTLLALAVVSTLWALDYAFKFTRAYRRTLRFYQAWKEDERERREARLLDQE